MEPSAGPTGGAGFALPACSASLICATTVKAERSASELLRTVRTWHHKLSAVDAMLTLSRAGCDAPDGPSLASGGSCRGEAQRRDGAGE